MNITDAYNIALAAYSSQQIKEGHGYDTYGFVMGNADTELAWDSLSVTQQKSFEEFALENADLFDSFPSFHQNDADMEQREETIKGIKEKLYSTFLFIK